MRIKRISRAVAVLLLFTMLLTVMPLSVFAEEPDHTEEPVGTEEIVAAETTPPETAAPTEATEDSPATDTAATTEPVDNEAETTAEEATAPASETTEDPNLAWNTQPSDGVTAVDDQGRLIRSTGIGGHGSLGWVIYPKQGAYAYTHAWTYANGNSATNTFGENGHFLLLNFLTPNGTPPNTVLDYENNPVVYCIQPEKATATGRAYWSEALTDVLSSEQIEAIKILCAYGWPWGYLDQPNGKMNTDDETAFQYQAATQILIWEVVMGIRSATPTYYVTDSRLYEVYNGTPTYQTYGDNSAFIAAYQEIAARLRRHSTLPSFANASASNAAAYAMSYNGSNYTLTLTDNNGVLDLDYSNFSAPDGISVSKSGNSLTITATPAALENGDQTITITGKKLRAGFQNIWVNGQGDQYLTSLDSVSKIPAYFKVKADTKTISLRKTSNASASVLECIQDNPLYTLAGAKYEIHQGSPTGPVVETLTTDANGNASGTVKYNIGTVLYAVEIVAPSGYLLNSSPVSLTVSSGSNVFNVSDTPTFDPNRLEIKKTGTSNEYIQGAIFKADFYAADWMDSTKLLRTWYFQSDPEGYVKFYDSYLAPGYASDPLFKPNGVERFPLGCVAVTEVQAAPGYITPESGDSGVCIFIRQGGTKVAQNGKAAGAYWGDFGAEPINTTNPRGIYKMENDSDRTITAVNRMQTNLEIVKTSTDGAVSGIQFEVEKLVGNAWTMLGSYTTNADGKISVETEQLSVGGQFRIREIVPQDYVCSSENPQIITLAEGLNTVSFVNHPIAKLEIVKTSTDGKVAGISFQVEQEVSGSWTALGTYKTDANGKIQIPNLDVGQKLRITEIVPDGYECTTDNPQTITLKRGTNTVTFTNKPTTSTCEIIKQSDDGNIQGITFTVKDSKGKVVYTGKTDKNGKISVPGLTIGETYTVIETVPENYIADKREQTIKIKEGTNSLTFVNHPTSRLELIKTSDDGNVKNISFTVEEYEPEGGIGWWTRGTYKTDADGKIDLELKYGYKYRVTETVPEDYVSENRVQEFTAKLGTNTLTFINHPTSRLELIKTSDDGNVKNISFTVEEYEPEGGIGWWTRGTYKTDADGKIDLELKYGYKYRVTETMPEDYVSENRIQEFTAQLGTNTLTFVNHPIAKLEIVKTSTDGKVAGISFKVEVQNSKKWIELGTYVSDANGKILVEDLEVGKKLRITEIVPENYICTSANPQTVTLKKGLNIVSFANRLLPSGHTVAANSETMGHYAYDLPSVDLEDAFYYENLLPGDKVTLIGFAKIVYEDETGETVVEDLLDADGVPVSSTVTFMAEQGNGVVTIPFPGLDLSRLGGKRIVFGERMYVNEQILVEHFDEADELQTIYVKNPSGHTTATVDATESHYTYITPEVEITDRYFYHDLMPGEHTVVGYPVRVIQAEDGTLTEEPVLVDGKPMEVPVTFTVEEDAPDGYVDIHFTIPGTEMKGTKIVIGEDLYFNGKKIQHHFDVNDEDQTVYPVIPEMGTTATVNGQHITYPVGMIAMQDVVALRNILPGTYRCEGQIMVKIKENGKTLAKPLLVDGKPVIASQEITVEAVDGKPQSVTVTMRFEAFDAELVRGLETVVFEKLFQIDGDKETETVTHENPEDEDQTVRFPDFKFRTVATAKGEHRVKAYGVLAPQDEVIYTEAIPGTTLIASATLMERVELLGKVYLVPFLVDGKAITGETTITVEKANGSLIVKFPAFDVGKLAGRKLVVVEEMFTLDASGKRIKLGEERDAENKEQTIEFYDAPTPPSPNTGDDPSLFWLWMFMFLGAVGAITSATALIRTKQRG